MFCRYCRLVPSSLRYVKNIRAAPRGAETATCYLQPDKLRPSTYPVCAFSTTHPVSIEGTEARENVEEHPELEASLDHEAEKSRRASGSTKSVPSKKRKQRSTRKREAKERNDIEADLETGTVSTPSGKASKPHLNPKQAAGSGPRAMKAIRRKEEQGLEIISPPGKPLVKAKKVEEKPEKKSPERWRIEKATLKEKFMEGYRPRKRLSPDAMPGIRMLHASDPATFTTPILAEHFKVSPEAIRRILKSKWRPSEAEDEDRRLRWDRRGERIWTKLAELGTRPPKKWRSMGVGSVHRKSGELPAWKKKMKTQGVGENVPFIEDDGFEDASLPKPRFADRII